MRGSGGNNIQGGAQLQNRNSLVSERLDVQVKMNNYGHTNPNNSCNYKDEKNVIKDLLKGKLKSKTSLNSTTTHTPEISHVGCDGVHLTYLLCDMGPISIL